MTKVDAWMPLWIGDYLADTMHLSAAEHGAYLLLLMHYWRVGALTDNDAGLARIARMSPSEWEEARPVISAFFKVEGGSWRHGRVESERLKASEGRERLTRRAQIAAAARHGKDKPASQAPRPAEPAEDGPVQLASGAQALLMQCPSPSPSEKKEQSPSDSDAAGAAPVVLPIRDLLWRDGLPIIRDLIGKSEAASRAFLGKMLKATNDDCARVHQVLREAHSLRPAEPAAWIAAGCGATSTPDRGAKRIGGGAASWAAAELRGMSGGEPSRPEAAPVFVPSVILDHAAE